MCLRIAFFLLFIAQILRGSPSLQWHGNSLNIAGYISILEDKTGEKTLENVLNDTLSWQNYPTDYLQLGYRNSYFWLKLEIDFKERPEEKIYWWFDISAPQDVQFYQVTHDSIVKYVQTGINFPFPERDVLNRLFIFSFQPNQTGKTILLARLHNDVGSILGYTYLHTATDFSIIDRKGTGVWFICFAFLCFSAFLTLGLWLVFRERIYIYYCAYLLCATLLLISVNGFGYEWFWSNAPHFTNTTKVLWTYGLVGFLMLFVYHLLFEPLKNHKYLKMIIQTITTVLFVMALMALFYYNFPKSLLQKMLLTANLTMLIGVAVIFLMLGLGIYKRYQPAYYFLLAIIPVAVTGILLLGRNAGLVHIRFLQSSFAIIPAFCIEIILLFVALLMRFRTLLKTQQEKLQLELESQYRLQNERERISRDLHDNVGAQLSYIISNIEYVLENPKYTVNRLQDVANAAKNAILNLRETIWAINNEQITVEDFYDRFKLYAANQVKNRPDIQLIFNENIIQNHVLNPNQALNLYRIIQEALNNALKYAQANSIEVSIQTNDNPYFEFTLKDDGIGFEMREDMEERHPDTSGTEGGYGLKNMKARAHDIGADFHIFSEKKKGTTVKICISALNQKVLKN